jgi:hypothetical protein
MFWIRVVERSASFWRRGCGMNLWIGSVEAAGEDEKAWDTKCSSRVIDRGRGSDVRSVMVIDDRVEVKRGWVRFRIEWCELRFESWRYAWTLFIGE